MNETKLNWDDLHLFLAVARGGGLSAAAVATGKSVPTLGRRMLALESAVGKELFVRHARGYELTPEGTAFLNKTVDLEAQIMPLARPKVEGAQVLVKISAGSWMTYALCQKAQSILSDNNTARLRFISAEHILDIAHRETVIGIRNRRPEQRGLACRKVGRVDFAGYAISAEITPWIRVLGNTPSAQWLVAQEHIAFASEVVAPRNALDLACVGVGRVLLPTFVGDAQSALIRVTPLVPELTHDQWLVTHNEERFVREVRQTIDRIYRVVRQLHGSND